MIGLIGSDGKLIEIDLQKVIYATSVIAGIAEGL
jgi:hypothetical protein